VGKLGHAASHRERLARPDRAGLVVELAEKVAAKCPYIEGDYAIEIEGE
jgi:hypothetical protein